jgi:predicted metal-binding membrane protein
MFGSGQSSGDVARDLVRDRRTWLTGAGLVALAALAWIAVVMQSRAMGSMPAAGGSDMAMPGAAMPAWISFSAAVAYVLAWGVMMAAMMLPSATPMISLYGAVRRNFSQTGQQGIPTAAFALVYLVLWLATGIPVYLANAAITEAAAMNPGLSGLLPYFMALALVAAGIYQFTPLKRKCLGVCSSPLAFLIGRWRGGYRGTFGMALENAVYCIGCCWGLMVVLVAAGAMSLPWVLSIAAVVFVEKIFPHGEWTARVTGGVLIALGILVVLQPALAATMRGAGMLS